MTFLGEIFWVYAVFSIPIWICLLIFRDEKKLKHPSNWSKVDIFLILLGLYFVWGGSLYIIMVIRDDIFQLENTFYLKIYRITFYQFIKFYVIVWILMFLLAVTLQRHPPENDNPLDWPTIDRCILFLWLYFFIAAARYFFGHVIGMLILSRPSHFADPFPHFISSFRLIYMAIFFLFLVIGLGLRKKTPESKAFPHLVIQFVALQQAGDCYFYGGLTEVPVFILGVSQSALMLIFFNTSVAVPGVLTFFVIFTVSMIGVWLNLIPYAPALSTSPFVNGKLNIFYSASAFFFISFTSLLMLSVITYLVIRWRRREDRVSEMTALLKRMFGRYLSTEVMNTFLENPSALELGGERRKVTIMMTDLRGFTMLSERLTPEQVVQLLNSYFEIMVNTVLEYNGTINEIVGDSLLVIFGAPQEMSDSAERSIACAIAMQNAMTDVNRENNSLGLPELEMGIGLNEAEVIVGNIGSSKRSKYAVVGSGVNMTSRIESFSVGGQILISQSLRQKIGDILRIDAQREVLPKGAETSIRIYEVGGIAGNFNLALKQKDPTCIKLLQQIPMCYTVIEGKHVGEKDGEGSITNLSKKSAEIILTRPLEPLTNIKMSLTGVYTELAGKDFYGKVIERFDKDGSIYLVRFTSVPPEIVAYFQAHQLYGEEQ